ncbi:hypothetical protein LSTR_LSTR005060 [Laodelphax striatellus]|uniref:Lipase domain-containing protein n=1 Tax=Laodelphax striatellus TaxID=195883 RepID=A0A482WT45_LAOST|nr:hypothetical protein LSTR_LSTR005060 [Laodelphax striatellus]
MMSLNLPSLLLAISYYLAQSWGMIIHFGPCVIVFGDHTCPDSRISYYLFTRKNPINPQRVVIFERWDNISLSNYNVSNPTKILIHGYNGNMFLEPLLEIKTEYLLEADYNIWVMNWPSLCESPCYPMAAFNTRHAGECLAQFVRRMQRLHPAPDLHVIGFSLGAHVAALAAVHLRPYKLPRITGLDPAMPFFMTNNKDHKLDPSDARFVDVLHTNAFVQGKPDRCGHVDFYMNDPIGCDHHRSLRYFSESIRSAQGFWGWPCDGMLAYLENRCPPRGEPCLMGAQVSPKSRGYYLVYTSAEAPFALGRWTGVQTNRTRWQRLVRRRGGRNEIETYIV